jgi:hypothetical protein
MAMKRDKHFGEHHQAQQHHMHAKDDKILGHMHGHFNQVHGLPKDAFAHGGADYRGGNPHGGSSMTGHPIGNTVEGGTTGGPDGPIGAAPEGMTENYGPGGDDLSEC